MNQVLLDEPKRVEYSADGTGESHPSLVQVELLRPEFLFKKIMDAIDSLPSNIDKASIARQFYERAQSFLVKASKKRSFSELDLYVQYKIANRFEVSEPIESKPDVDDLVSRILSSVEEVKRVYIFRERDTISVWTFIDESDRPFRKKIYAAEKEIFNAFPDLYFDFHVVSSTNEEINSLVPTNARLVFERK